MSGFKAPINIRCRITILIDNPLIPCIASCVPCIASYIPWYCSPVLFPCLVMLVAVATNIIGYTITKDPEDMDPEWHYRP